MATLIRKRRAPMTAASKAIVTTALQVRTLGQMSRATSWAIPDQTKKFIARLWKNERPCRAAAAPTTSPNAMMPGATGSPCRNPATKPDQPGLPDNGFGEGMANPRQLPGLVPASTCYRIEPKTWMPGTRLVLGPAERRTRVPGMAQDLTVLRVFRLAVAGRPRRMAARDAGVACRPAAPQRIAGCSARSPTRARAACLQADR